MVVEELNRTGESGHSPKFIDRKGEVQDENLSPCDIANLPGLSVARRTIDGAVTKFSPGGVGCTESVEAIGMVIDGGSRSHDYVIPREHEFVKQPSTQTAKLQFSRIYPNSILVHAAVTNSTGLPTTR